MTELLLLSRIREGLRDRHSLTLIRSDRSMTDCRPVSVFGIWTARQLSDEIGTAIDHRRFRANIYIDFESRRGFAEDELVGETLRIGPKATIAILERDPRCKMITLDPETAEQNPEVMRCVVGKHDGKAGVYAAVLIEGTIHSGDDVALLD
jgi:MOSC domain-containing protein